MGLKSHYLYFKVKQVLLFPDHLVVICLLNEKQNL